MAKKEEYIEEAPETIIGATVKVEGDLVSEGNIKVDGLVTGKIKTSRDLYVGPSAKIEADVEAGNAMLAGSIKGDVKVPGKLQIEETGRIEGNVVCGRLSIAEGAYFAGNCSMSDSDNYLVEQEQEMEEEEE